MGGSHREVGAVATVRGASGAPAGLGPGPAHGDATQAGWPGAGKGPGRGGRVPGRWGSPGGRLAPAFVGLQGGPCTRREDPSQMWRREQASAQSGYPSPRRRSGPRGDTSEPCRPPEPFVGCAAALLSDSRAGHWRGAGRGVRGARGAGSGRPMAGGVGAARRGGAGAPEAGAEPAGAGGAAGSGSGSGSGGHSSSAGGRGRSATPAAGRKKAKASVYEDR
ncbi:uncharacterized protein LOC144579224 [Callithrix jacchus]